MLLLVIFLKFLVLSSVIAKNQSFVGFYGLNDPRKSPGNYTNLKAADYPILKPKFELPKTFDARQKWPECESIRTAEDQGRCGNCWALSVVGALSDRWCVAYGPKYQRFFSADDLTTCCDCGGEEKNGCKGGDIAPSLYYWVTTGICSGGPYGSNIGCKPYSDSLFYHLKSTYDPTPPNPPVPCKKSCYKKEFPVSYQRDKRKGYDSYIIKRDPERMQWEIFFFGPIIGGLQIQNDIHTLDTDDILMSEGGDGNNKSWHGVILIGWGEQNGVPYWLGRNTWGPYFGRHGGFYRLLRGQNRANIEETAWVPIVDYAARTKTMAAATSTTTESSKSVSSSDSGLRPSNMLPILMVVYTIIRLY